jgi:starch-binding outer membrane protein, SusD/RagB family
MKTIILTILATALTILGPACKKKFLQASPIGEELQSTYYSNPDQAFAGLVAVYHDLSIETASVGDGSYSNKLGPLNAAADECYAGGGTSTDMNPWQAWNTNTMTAALDPGWDFWDIDYQGVSRANLMLQVFAAGPVPGLSSALQSRYIAECQFLRAYYYFELVRLFKNIPLILKPLTPSDLYNQLQVADTAVYSQIEKDLNAAIAVLPPTVVQAELGRATQGAAQALLGKVILYENDNSRMQEAAAWFEKVNGSGLYSLMTNFSDIFSPANKFNSESIWEIQHTSTQDAGYGNWGNNQGNVYVAMVGPRSYNGPTVWGQGWSFNPIIPSFVNFIKSDPRYGATVLNIDSIVAASGGAVSYTQGYANTGFFIQKYAPLNQWANNTAGDAHLNFPNDYIEIRLADTYLMEAEALVRGGGDQTSAQSYLDKVRARVGLPSIPATLDNIYNERRLELATEGHRWYDLVRTGQAASALAFKGFKSGVNDKLPIPLAELNNTKLVQNPGY